MTPVTMAEWVLALVMPRERAAAVVGDLSEGLPSRFGFWLAVLRTAGRATFALLAAPGFPKAVLSVVLLSLTLRIMSTSTLTMSYLMSTSPGWTAYIPSMLFSVGAGTLGVIANTKLLAGRRSETWIAIALFAALHATWWVVAPQSVAGPILMAAPANLVMSLLGGMFLSRREWRRREAHA